MKLIEPYITSSKVIYYGDDTINPTKIHLPYYNRDKDGPRVELEHNWIFELKFKVSDVYVPYSGRGNLELQLEDIDTNHRYRLANKSLHTLFNKIADGSIQIIDECFIARFIGSKKGAAYMMELV